MPSPGFPVRSRGYWRPGWIPLSNSAMWFPLTRGLEPFSFGPHFLRRPSMLTLISLIFPSLNPRTSSHGSWPLSPSRSPPFLKETGSSGPLFLSPPQLPGAKPIPFLGVRERHGKGFSIRPTLLGRHDDRRSLLLPPCPHPQGQVAGGERVVGAPHN